MIVGGGSIAIIGNTTVEVKQNVTAEIDTAIIDPGQLALCDGGILVVGSSINSYDGGMDMLRWTFVARPDRIGCAPASLAMGGGAATTERST